MWKRCPKKTLDAFIHFHTLSYALESFTCFHMLLYAFHTLFIYFSYAFHTLSYAFYRLSYAFKRFYYAFICSSYSFYTLSYAFIRFHTLSYAFYMLLYAFKRFYMLFHTEIVVTMFKKAKRPLLLLLLRPLRHLHHPKTQPLRGW